MSDCHDPSDPWCGDRPALECEYEHIPEGADRVVDAVIELNGRYAFACPNSGAVAALVDLGPVIELGAGGGYWARLLRDRGCHVAAFDNRSWAEIPHASWTDVQHGDETVLDDYRAWTLLLVMPRRPGLGRIVSASPGRRLVIVASGPIPNPTWEADASDALQAGGWALTEAFPLPDPHSLMQLTSWER